MQSFNSYRLAQDQTQEVTGSTKEQRESQVCQRRLKQMAAKHEKAERAAARKQLAKEQDK